MVFLVFQSTRPVWGATPADYPAGWEVVISIHAPRMGRDDMTFDEWQEWKRISIHAPRMGRDWWTKAVLCFRPISIHAPRMGRDTNANTVTVAAGQFQSTRPVWGATVTTVEEAKAKIISIHAPRMGRDDRGRP